MRVSPSNRAKMRIHTPLSRGPRPTLKLTPSGHTRPVPKSNLDRDPCATPEPNPSEDARLAPILNQTGELDSRTDSEQEPMLRLRTARGPTPLPRADPKRGSTSHPRKETERVPKPHSRSKPGGARVTLTNRLSHPRTELARGHSQTDPNGAPSFTPVKRLNGDPHPMVERCT